MLAPQDRFAIFTETVTCGDPSKKVQLTTTLPAVSDSTAEPDVITRELGDGFAIASPIANFVPDG